MSNDGITQCRSIKIGEHGAAQHSTIPPLPATLPPTPTDGSAPPPYDGGGNQGTGIHRVRAALR